jgi:metal-responsive CopG/Arc/MetJ family transcriptional regulator
MSEDSDIKAKQRSDRLREALRANLRRRKAMNDKGIVTGPSSRKPAD